MAMTPETARDLTDRIKAAAEAIWQLIAQAYLDRAWEALEYGSWDDYCAREFGDCRLRLPREERREIVASMRELGMSTRAIAAATGMSVGSVHATAAGVQIRTPDSVAGLDGKTYQPNPHRRGLISAPGPIDRRGDAADGEEKSQARRRRPIAEAFDAVRYDLVKRAETLARLAADDRFDRHAGQLSLRYRFDLVQARDAIQAVLDRMPEPTTESREG